MVGDKAPNMLCFGHASFCTGFVNHSHGCKIAMSATVTKRDSFIDQNSLFLVVFLGGKSGVFLRVKMVRNTTLYQRWLRCSFIERKKERKKEVKLFVLNTIFNSAFNRLFNTCFNRLFNTIFNRR